MKHRPINPVVLVTFLALAMTCAADPAPPAPPAPRTTHFKLRLIGANTSDPGNTHLESDAESAYAWTVNGQERTLSYDSMHMAVKVDGKLTTDITMSAKRYAKLQEDGTVADVDLEHAPDRMRAALADTFNTPLAKLTVDADGRELEGSRTILAVRAGKALVDNGALISSTLMHTPFFPDKNEWQAPAAISIGGSNTTQGTL